MMTGAFYKHFDNVSLVMQSNYAKAVKALDAQYLDPENKVMEFIEKVQHRALSE